MPRLRLEINGPKVRFFLLEFGWFVVNFGSESAWDMYLLNC